MSSGLDWVFQQCEEAIILEDDCLPGTTFFKFCSEMLRRYRYDNRVMHVSGDNFQDGILRGSGSYFFSRYPLGWASWKRAWRYYDLNISTWPEAYCARWLEAILGSQDEIRYWESIFDHLYRGQINTWDYQWVYACWRQKGLAIQPNENLVSNIGVGHDATHFEEVHSTIAIPIREFRQFVDPAVVSRDDGADSYTFKQHINKKRADKENWLSMLKRDLAFRRRIRSILPRSWRYH
jgi:hypothetical protein